MVQADTDMFVASPDRAQMPFFQKLDAQEPRPGAIWSLTTDWLERDLPPYLSIYDMSWQNRVYEGTHVEKSDQWLQHATALTDVLTVSGYRDIATEQPRVHGGLYAYPARHYHAEHPGECQWLFEAGRRLQEDEGVFSLYQAWGKPFWSISDTLDIPFAGVVQDMVERRKRGPYFCHPGDIWRPEMIWRHDIDSMCDSYEGFLHEVEV